MDKKPQIVLMLGYPKSGSTVFGELIGQIDDFLHVGEMERLWFTTEAELSLYPLKDCSCGKRLRFCEFWKPYLTKVTERIEEINRLEGLNLTNKDFLDWRNNYIIKKKFSSKEVKLYTDIIYRLYKNVSQGENKIILDTSKELWYAQFLESTNLFDISYIHLIRDLEGVVYSRQKKLKTYNPKSGKVRLNYKYVVYDILMWNILNFKIRRFLSNKNSILIKYNNMVANPKKNLEKVCALMKLKTDFAKVLNENKEFYINENHLVHGNRFRKKRGVIKIKKDRRVNEELKFHDRIVINNLNFSLSGKFKRN